MGQGFGPQGANSIPISILLRSEGKHLIVRQLFVVAINLGAWRPQSAQSVAASSVIEICQVGSEDGGKEESLQWLVYWRCLRTLPSEISVAGGGWWRML